MNFFQAYNQFRKNTESHQHFHLWAGISAISTLLGKRCFIGQGMFDVFPHLYVVLVGQPATKKSTAVNFAHRITQQVPEVSTAPSSASRESLVDWLESTTIDYEVGGGKYYYSSAAVFADEFASFVGGKHISESMITFLTEIYSCDTRPFKEIYRKSGKKIIEAPCLTLLGACTPSFFDKGVKTDIISGGFTRRTIFVYEDEVDHLVPIPVLTQEQTLAWPVLVKEANRIFKICGEFVLTKEAEALHTEYYIRDAQIKREVNEKLASYYSSRHVLRFKIAMCLSAGYGSNRVVDSTIMKLADELLATTEFRLEELFRGVGRNELKLYQERVLEFLHNSAKDTVKRRDIYRHLAADVTLAEFQEIMDALERQGFIKSKVMIATDRPEDNVIVPMNKKLDRPFVNMFDRICARVETSEVKNQPVPAPNPPPGAVPIERKPKQDEAESQSVKPLPSLGKIKIKPGANR